MKIKIFFLQFLAFQTIFEKFDQKVFIITVDTPFVKIESIEKLINDSNNFDITIAQTEKTHNLCGVFSNNISLKLLKNDKNDIHKINYLVKNKI
jgi:molybdopterin-guanine dinucleotide biosynthesis protein A